MVVGGGRKRTFLDIRGQVLAGGEQGLLSVAFAPDYASSGRFYVYFTDKSGDQRVVEYQRASANRADAGSARLVLRMADSEGNHNGGLLLFGPDKHLYIGTGDGGGAGDQHGARGNAQNLGVAARQAPAHRPGRRRVAGPTPSPPTTRSSAAAARAARSTATACATRGASRSTAAPATWRSATSARTRSRRSTSSAAARARARTSAGARSRAARATPRARARPATCRP